MFLVRVGFKSSSLIAAMPSASALFVFGSSLHVFKRLFF